jgi:hypothetical protein
MSIYFFSYGEKYITNKGHKALRYEILYNYRNTPNRIFDIP